MWGGAQTPTRNQTPGTCSCIDMPNVRSNSIEGTLLPRMRLTISNYWGITNCSDVFQHNTEHHTPLGKPKLFTICTAPPFLKIQNTNESSGGTSAVECNPSACQIIANADTTSEVGTLQPKTVTPVFNILLNDLSKTSALFTYLTRCAGEKCDASAFSGRIWCFRAENKTESFS